MKFDKDDILDLNEENIKNLFSYCVATKDSTPDNIMSTRFIDKTSGFEIPDMFFLTNRIKEKSNSIRYLIGQLKSIHSHDLSMSLSEGFYKYDNSIWTQNKMLLFSLYYMGNAASIFPLFSNSSDGLIAILKNYPELKPTLSPNDPNFRKKIDGQEPADD